MKIEWMGKYRELVESIIFLCNCASTEFVTLHNYGTDYKITAREVQILEYLLEDTSGNMVEVAGRLGVTRGAFSNIVNKLVAKGMIEKIQHENNKKNIYPAVTELGKKTYEQYQVFIQKQWFAHMFEMADQIPDEYISQFSHILKEMGESMKSTK